MRLTTEEITNIKTIISNFDPAAKIYLYGSRTDDSKRGGDIDLLVLSTQIDFMTKINLKLKLYDALGEQKIDLLVKPDCSEAFTQMAVNEGILL